jgi:ferredoxin
MTKGRTDRYGLCCFQRSESYDSNNNKILLTIASYSGGTQFAYVEVFSIVMSEGGRLQTDLPVICSRSMSVLNLTQSIRENQQFIREVEELSGENINSCYQCGKCTAGCPVALEMDYTPRQIIRMVQLGMKEEVLKCSTIWLCASCVTCTARCPREVDLAKIMDALRILARREGFAPIQNLIHVNMCFLSHMYSKIAKLR